MLTRRSRLRPIGKARRRLQKADREFQRSGETHRCAVGHYSESTCWHHVIGRRHLETRHYPKNCVRLCMEHHTELHMIGNTAFAERYRSCLTEEDYEKLWAIGKKRIKRYYSGYGNSASRSHRTAPERL